MKTFIATIYLLFCGYYLSAQNQDIETEIRTLEQTEVKAILNKDTVTLKKLWDKDYIVNNPENKIIPAKSNQVDRPVLQKSKSSFTREVEKILVNGDIAISMGNETIVAITNQSEQTVKRRYTNIWMQKGDSWKLVARHANVICQ